MVPAILERLFRAAERRKWTLAFALITPGWVAVVRMLLERELSMGPVALGRPPFPWFAHIFLFYVALHVSLTALLARVAKLEWQVAAGPVGMGLTLGTVPPMIDVAVYGIGHFAYEYQPTIRELPWTLHLPPNVLPWGETIVLWSTIALMMVAGLRYRVGILKTLALGVVTWLLVLVFLVGIPASSDWLSHRIGLAPSEWRNALFALATFIGAVVATGTARRLATRTLHVLLAPLIALVGAAFRGTLDATVLLTTVHLALLSAGFALANDWHDRVEDAAQGRGPALDESSAQLLTLIPTLAIAHVLAFRIELALTLIGFAIVSYAYHADPLRLKCVFPLSYKTEGFLGGLAFFAGITSVQPAFLTAPQLWASLAVTLGTPGALMFKDLKDVEGDRAGGVRSLFVVLEGRGWSRVGVRFLTGALLALSLGVVVAVTAAMTPSEVLLLVAHVGLAGLAVGAVLSLAPVRAVALGFLLAELVLIFAAWRLGTRFSLT